MNILLLAPQPFYQERGTPIAVKLLIETLCEAGHFVDLLTYHEGEDIAVPGLKIYRIAQPPFVKNIPIGFSWKKLVCDLHLTNKLLKLIRINSYHVVHAVEETIFPALLLKHFYKFKLIYDMDSSLVDQLIDKYNYLRLLQKVLNKQEGWAFRGSDLVIPVCQNLANKAKNYVPENKICILQDIPFESVNHVPQVENLRHLLSIDDCFALYVGNLEHYQGIDLMLEGMANIPAEYHLELVVIGGKKSHIEKYTSVTKNLGLAKRVHFLGPRPLSSLSEYLAQADILVSPRVKGENTPMKIYSYLASGRPVLATKIESHTQIMDSSCTMLVDPTPASIAIGFTKLIKDSNLRLRLGQAGKDLVEKKYCLKVYKRKLLDSYAWLTQTVCN